MIDIEIIELEKEKEENYRRERESDLLLESLVNSVSNFSPFFPHIV